MNALPNHTLRTPRRLIADRRLSRLRRSSVVRRESQRRVAVTTVDVQRRSLSDRRTDTNRRQDERRAGVIRRFGERRRETDAKRILLVDGDATVRGSLKRVLIAAGLEVIEAHEGHAGLSYASGGCGCGESETPRHGRRRIHPTTPPNVGGRKGGGDCRA